MIKVDILKQGIDKKYCQYCDTVKEKSQFWKKNGMCKSCRKGYMKEYMRQKAKAKKEQLEVK